MAVEIITAAKEEVQNQKLMVGYVSKVCVFVTELSPKPQYFWKLIQVVFLPKPAQTAAV